MTSEALLRVRGARQHALRDLDLDLPTNALVAIVGVSGSGKSSLAFDTVHAEAQRRYLEAVAGGSRVDLPTLPRPDVDVLSGLPPTVALPQDVARPGRRSTVATLVDVAVLLRVLFARAGTLHDPDTGETVHVTPLDHVVDAAMAAGEGTRLLVEAPVPVTGDGTGILREIARAGFSRVRWKGEVVRLDDIDETAVPDDLRIVVDRVRVAADRRARVEDAVRLATRAGDGRVVLVADGDERAYADRPLTAAGVVLPALRPALFAAPGPEACPTCEGAGFVEDTPCEACEGTGMGPVARAVSWRGRTLPELLAEPLDPLRAWFAAVPRDPVTAPILAEVGGRLDALHAVGLGHLSLGRRADALSYGELRRLRLARQVGADLSGVLFVLDEPAAGLDADRVADLVRLLRGLVARGNGVFVVEHHPAILDAADHVVEFGPGPGRDGGRVVYEGTADGLRSADTPTGRWLAGPGRGAPPAGRTTGWMTLHDPEGANLVDATARVAVGGLTVVDGPSGAGKSAWLDALTGHLAARTLDRVAPAGRLDGGETLTRVLVVDEAAARRSRRSMPATYVGLWDVVRELLAATREAQVRGFDAGTFSLNVKGGRCEACHGLGVRRVDLHVLPSVDVVCEVCEGRRFARDVLEVRWKGRDASELLALTADEALPILAGHPRLEEALRALQDVRLGYVPLGQPAHTLSGGEAQRLRLARELVRAARRGAADTAFVLDDPTSGLHPADVADLTHLLVRLVEEGATLVVASHEPLLRAAADHVVTLGPGVGPEGGRVVSDGPP